MDLEPWEALDIDDSDLSTFLRPCNNRTSQTLTPEPPLIPGPAGAVQAAMIQRRTLGASNPLPTQEFVRRVVQNGHDTDRDFTSNPWLFAFQFLQSSQVDVASFTDLRSIKKNRNDEGRVTRVIAVIKSCNPNGFGDMTVTLKDPTGTIGASIHGKVFTEGEFRKDITVGSVLLLHNVAVFCPNGFTCYLNITSSNIVKVFSKDKDSGSPSEQISMKQTAPISTAETREKSWMPLSSAFSLSQVRTDGILNNIRLDSRFREVADNGSQRDGILPLSRCHFDNEDDKSQRTVSIQDGAGPVEATCGDQLESEMEDQENHPTLGKGDNLAGIAQANSSSSNPIHISVGQETDAENHLERQEIMNPKSSIPQWTDEQLDELLAFDRDDDLCLS